MNNELNEKLKGLDLSNQVKTILLYSSGLNAFNEKEGEEISKAGDTFINDIFEKMNDYYTKLDKLLLMIPINSIKNIVINKIQLQLDEYDRVLIYYKDNMVGMVRFMYKKEVNKRKLECLFHDAIDNNLDICLKIKNKNIDEIIINKNDTLNDKLNYYLNNFDNNLVNIKDSNIQITDVSLIKFGR